MNYIINEELILFQNDIITSRLTKDLIYSIEYHEDIFYIFSSKVEAHVLKEDWLEN